MKLSLKFFYRQAAKELREFLAKKTPLLKIEKRFDVLKKTQWRVWFAFGENQFGFILGYVAIGKVSKFTSCNQFC